MKVRWEVTPASGMVAIDADIVGLARRLVLGLPASAPMDSFLVRPDGSRCRRTDIAATSLSNR
jgi:hypothetical protein